MRIVVLAKQVPDTWSNRRLDLQTGVLDRAASEPVPDEISERALENSLRQKDAHPDTEVVALAMGPEETTKTLRKLLSMGADSAVLVSDPQLAGSDTVQTARILAAALDRIGGDLIIAGNEATDGRGGVVPAMVAELLGRPLLPALDELEISLDSVRGTVRVDDATVRVAASLPALVSVTEKSAEARFPNFKGIRTAKKKPLDIWQVADLGLEVPAATARSVMVSAEERPAKVAGPKVVDDGTAAGQLANFLASNRLI